MPSRTVSSASWDGAVLAPGDPWCIGHVDIIIYGVYLPNGHHVGRIDATLSGWSLPPDGRPRRRNHGSL